MSGYWSFREPAPRSPAQGTSDTTPPHRLPTVWDALPTAIESVGQGPWGLRDDSLEDGGLGRVAWLGRLGAVEGTLPHPAALSGKSAVAPCSYKETEHAAGHVHSGMTSTQLADITPSVPESPRSGRSSLSQVRPCSHEESGEAAGMHPSPSVSRCAPGEAIGCEQGVWIAPHSSEPSCNEKGAGSGRGPVANLRVTEDVVDGLACDVQREWWWSRMGVDVRPIPLLAGAAAEAVVGGTPDAPSCDAGMAGGGSGGAEDVAELAFARGLVRGRGVHRDDSDTAAADGGTAPPSRPHPRPTSAAPTRPRAFSLHTDGRAARRGVVRAIAAEEATCARDALSTLPQHRPRLARRSVEVGTAPPPPGFVLRMEERAAARRAARAQRQQRPSPPSETASDKKPAVREAGSTDEGSTVGAGVAAGTPRAPPPPAAATGKEVWPLLSYFTDLVGAMAVAGGCQPAFSPDGSRPYVSVAQRREHQRELAQVAAHYHACRSTHVALARWRAGVSRRAARRARAAQWRATWEVALSQLVDDERERRCSGVAESEAHERRALQRAFQTQTAYQVLCVHRRAHERFIMRWYFGLWIERARDVQADCRASAYREHLRQCAAEALRGLQR